MHQRTKKPTKNQQFDFKKWLKKHWIIISIIGAAMVIAAIFIASILSVKGPDETSIFNPKPKIPEKYYSKLTGVEVSEKSAISKPVTAIMIENSPDARPHSGLKQAEVVYETVAEGGVTRFMALYQQNKPGLAGPIRSLRMYYLDWAAPYQASIAHVGGSANALSEVRNGSYRDIDQYFNADSYWRSTDRYAPHNVYTSFERIDALNDAKGYKNSNFESFKRKDGQKEESTNATTVNIAFSGPLYGTSYSYHAESNTYHRSMAGQPHHDREEGQIQPSVVVALKVGAKPRQGAQQHQDIITEGEGKAYIFQNGIVQEAKWQKADRKSALKLVDSEGNSVALNRGQTWIAATTEESGVSWQ